MTATFLTSAVAAAAPICPHVVASGYCRISRPGWSGNLSPRLSRRRPGHLLESHLPPFVSTVCSPETMAGCRAPRSPSPLPNLAARSAYEPTYTFRRRFDGQYGHHALSMATAAAPAARTTCWRPAIWRSRPWPAQSDSVMPARLRKHSPARCVHPPCLSARLFSPGRPRSETPSRAPRPPRKIIVREFLVEVSIEL